MYKNEQCPNCGSVNWKVIDSRPTEKGRRRRKHCLDCNHRWSTIEYTKTDDRIADLEKAIDEIQMKLDTVLKVCARLSRI